MHSLYIIIYRYLQHVFQTVSVSILQGSAATCLRYYEVFHDHFTTNLLLKTPSAKES